MNVAEAARHFQVDRKTILAICHDPELSGQWGCVMVGGEWEIRTPPESDKWYKPKCIAEIMDKTERQVQRWCRAGIISAIRFGIDYRIPKSEAMKLYEKRGINAVFERKKRIFGTF